MSQTLPHNVSAELPLQHNSTGAAVQFVFRLQDKLSFIINANTDARDRLIGQLKSDRSSCQHVVTIDFGECQSGMSVELTDSKIETLQDRDQDGCQIE